MNGPEMANAPRRENHRVEVVEDGAPLPERPNTTPSRNFGSNIAGAFGRGGSGSVGGLNNNLGEIFQMMMAQGQMDREERKIREETREAEHRAERIMQQERFEVERVMERERLTAEREARAEARESNSQMMQMMMIQAFGGRRGRDPEDDDTTLPDGGVGSPVTRSTKSQRRN